jgi:DNA-binding transcriptional MerR regulator
MKIGDAVKITGLTKKAIRYYEEEGLIEPCINDENNYREYSQDDVRRLLQISVYRSIDMPMSLIKKILNSGSNEKVLKEHLTNIEGRIDSLNRIKDTVNRLISNDVDFAELNRDIASNRKREKDYVIKKLTELFPGFYGKYLLIHFGEHLSVPLDTKEQEEAFDRIVDYLDNSDEIEINYPDEWKKYLQDFDEEKYLESLEHVDKRMKDLGNLDSEGFEKLKAEIKSMIDKQNSEEYKEQFQFYNKLKQEWTDILKKNGYYDVFIYNMKILSPKYKKYVDELNALNERLHLKYDSDGNAVISDEK